MGFLSDIVSVAAPVVGAMSGIPGGAQIGAAVGGAISGRQRARQAGETAAQYAARMSQIGQRGFFRPVTVRTFFGESDFDVDPRTGAVTRAAYTPSQAVQEERRRLGVLMGQGLTTAEEAVPFAREFLPAARGLFAVGQQYLPTDRRQAEQQYVQEQLALLRPSDIEEEQRLAASVFGRGRGGLSVGPGGQPELQALAEARRRRDLQIAAQARPEVMRQIEFAAQQQARAGGLLGTGYDIMRGSMAPYEGYLGTQARLEELAQRPLQMGVDIGRAALPGQQYGGTFAERGARGIAQQQLAAEERRDEIIQGLLSNKELIGDITGAVRTGAERIGGLFGTPAPIGVPTPVLIPGGGIGGAMGAYSNMSKYGSTPVPFAGQPVSYI